MPFFVKSSSFPPEPGVPSDDSPYVKAKHAQLINMDLSKAIPLFWTAINSRDHVASALKDMAVVMKQLNRAEEAIEAINSFRHLCPASAQSSIDNVLVDLYKKSGRLDEQIELLERKLQILCEEWKFTGKERKIVRSQGKRIRITMHQERSRLIGNLAWAYMQKQNYSKAEELYREALLIEPDANKKCNLAICLMHRGEIERAKCLIQNVLSGSSSSGALDALPESCQKSLDRACEMLDEIEHEASVDKSRGETDELGFSLRRHLDEVDYLLVNSGKISSIYHEDGETSVTRNLKPDVLSSSSIRNGCNYPQESSLPGSFCSHFGCVNNVDRKKAGVQDSISLLTTKAARLQRTVPRQPIATTGFESSTYHRNHENKTDTGNYHMKLSSGNHLSGPRKLLPTEIGRASELKSTIRSEYAGILSEHVGLQNKFSRFGIPKERCGEYKLSEKIHSATENSRYGARSPAETCQQELTSSFNPDQSRKYYFSSMLKLPGKPEVKDQNWSPNILLPLLFEKFGEPGSQHTKPANQHDGVVNSEVQTKNMYALQVPKGSMTISSPSESTLTS